MSRTVTSPSAIRLTLEAPPRIETELLVVPLFEGQSAADAIPELDAATSGELRRASESGELGPRPYEFFMTPLLGGGGWRAHRVAFVGGGRPGEADSERFRKLATAAGTFARQRRIPRLAFLLLGAHATPVIAQAVAEGFTLATFSSDQYKTGERLGPAPDEMVVAAANGPAAAAALEQAVERGRILGDSCNLARALSNEPSNVLTPRVFADRAAQIARDAGLQVEVLDEKAIERLGMGLLLGVARGSVEPPRVIVMKHEPPQRTAVAGPRAGRQGHHVRYGRHLDQAGRRHGADEGRHGRRRRRRLRDARHRAARRADPRDRRRADDREHAGRPGA